MKSELVKIASLSADPANTRSHGERNLAAIVASLKRFGQQKPIVVDADGVVVAGNGTLAAAQSLGWEKVAVVRSKLNGSDRTAYAIADNRSAELAEWDIESLAGSLAALQNEEGFDHLVAGFTDEDIEKLTGKFDVSVVGMPDLPSGDREPFQQMTFTLSDEQAGDVKRALAAAKESGPFVDTGNKNGNGNALARIVEQYLGAC